jgi:hypothetical protein
MQQPPKETEGGRVYVARVTEGEIGSAPNLIWVGPQPGGAPLEIVVRTLAGKTPSSNEP